MLGDGAGGYRYTYLRERAAPDAPPAVRDAHSVELENLSELGIVGLALFASAIGGAAAGAVRARRLGPAGAWVSAFALTAGAYWLVHSSVDWFWPYPASDRARLRPARLGLRARRASRPARSAGGRGRLIVAAAAIALAISTVPPFLSERYVDDAYDELAVRSLRAPTTTSIGRAALNPLSVDPLLAEGAIARASGDRARAIGAFREAIAKRPEEWVSYYLLAVLHQRAGSGAGAPRAGRGAGARSPQRLGRGPGGRARATQLRHA